MTDSQDGGLIPPHGGYDNLKSYQMSQLVYDATIKLCDRFIDPRSRTHDQMVQAARSENKNIAEGSQASGTSKKIELKLTGIARASLEELLGDYKDFLRQRGLTEWGKNHPMARMVRRLAYAPNRSYKDLRHIHRERSAGGGCQYPAMSGAPNELPAGPATRTTRASVSERWWIYRAALPRPPAGPTA